MHADQICLQGPVPIKTSTTAVEQLQSLSALELFGNDTMMHIFCVLHDFHTYMCMACVVC